MHVISVKEWMNCKPENRKELLKKTEIEQDIFQGHTQNILDCVQNLNHFEDDHMLSNFTRNAIGYYVLEMKDDNMFEWFCNNFPYLKRTLEECEQHYRSN